MEAIREYLSNLFMSLPETPEVLRAKAALLEIMEDKYEELIKERKTEKEAIGIVISEFGDLHELAGELGIEGYMNNMQDNAQSQSKFNGANNENGRGNVNGQSNINGQYRAQGMNGSGGHEGSGGRVNVENIYRWSFEDVKKYISYAWTHAAFIAAAVFLCICAPFVETVFEACGAGGYMAQVVADSIGMCIFFLFIAVAVILFCSAYEMKKRYGKMSRCGVVIDEKTGEYATQRHHKDSNTKIIMRFAGIFICIISVIPSSVNYFTNPFISEILDCSVLLIAGVGVFLLVLSSSVGNRYEELEKAVKNAGNARYAGSTGNAGVTGGGGYSQGGDFRYTEWKRPPKKKLSSTAILILVFTGVLVVGGNIAANILYMKWQDVNNPIISDTGEFAFDDISKIELDLDFTELQIVRSQTTDDDGKVRIEYEGNSLYTPEVTSSGGRLFIQEKNNRRFGWFSCDLGWLARPAMRQGSLLVVLPQTSDTKDYEMIIDVDAGNISCSGLQMTNLDVDLDVGNAVIENCRVNGKASIDVDAGNVEVNESEIFILKGGVDAGNMGCHLTGSTLDSYNMELDTDLGNIIINGDSKGGNYKQTSKSNAESNNITSRIEIEVDLGDININVPTE